MTQRLDSPHDAMGNRYAGVAPLRACLDDMEQA